MSSIAACPLMRALWERDSCWSSLLSDYLEMDPSAKTPGVVLVRSRQLMHYNRNASKVDGL